MEAEFKTIDAHSAQNILGKSNIVDIRQKQDYDDAHIKGAQWVGDDNVEDFLKNADKNAPLICYCYHGFSSQQAAVFFKSSGFKEVYSLEGGFENWKLNYPFEEIF